MNETEAEDKKTDETEHGREGKSKKHIKAAALEGGCLFAVLVVCRAWIFPILARTGELHTRMALESIGMGLTATVFAAFAITVKKTWKTKGIYILYPFIFFLFALGLSAIANEVNFG